MSVYLTTTEAKDWEPSFASISDSALDHKIDVVEAWITGNIDPDSIDAYNVTLLQEFIVRMIKRLADSMATNSMLNSESILGYSYAKGRLGAQDMFTSDIADMKFLLMGFKLIQRSKNQPNVVKVGRSRFGRRVEGDDNVLYELIYVLSDEDWSDWTSGYDAGI